MNDVTLLTPDRAPSIAAELCPAPALVPVADAGSQKTLDFIRDTFGPVSEAPVWIMSLGNDRNGDEHPRHIATRDLTDIDSFVFKLDRAGRGLFFCVSTIDGTKRNKDNVAEMIGLHVDIDFKDIDATAEDIDRILKNLPHPPSRIHASGNGRHCFWLFKEALGPDQRDRVDAALKLICDLVGGDQAVAHCVALMRLPGTHNTKFGHWNEVTTIANSGIRYELDDLEEWISEASPVILRKNRPAIVTDNNHFLEAAKAQGFKPSIDVEKRLAGMSYMVGGDAAIHTTQLSVSASLLTSGMDTDEVVKLILDATRGAAAGYGERWNWTREENAIRRMCSDWLRKHPVSEGGPVPATKTNESVTGAVNPTAIVATPYVWRDPAAIPRREWLYGTHLIRQFASATFAPGGVGKSSLVLTDAIAMATGRDLIGIKPRQRCRVWYWNGEDPADEMDRRIAAICINYNIKREDLEGWLFVDSGRNQEIIIASQTKNGAVIAEPVVDALIATIRANSIDVFSVDPFISSHRVTENDNPAIDLVAKEWSRIADVTNCAIELVHHTRKTGGAEATVEDGRGAGALKDAVRSARVLNVMDKAEADKAGIVGHRRYFKMENGKANLAPPPEGADWFLINSVLLGNGEANNPFESGDNVGVVTAWKWPDALDGVTGSDFEKAATAIRASKWRENIQAAAWVGHAVADALGFDVEDKADKAKVNAIVKAWQRAGTLIVVDGLDAKGEKVKFIEVAEDA